MNDELIDRALGAIRQMLETEKKNDRSPAELSGIMAGACSSYLAHFRKEPDAEPWTVMDALRLAGACIHLACALHAQDHAKKPEETLQ